jgi:hypothetical protein
MQRGLIVAILGFLILTQYVNCSSYSDTTLSEGVSTGIGGEVTSYEGVKVLNGDTYMNCNEDHVQLGGSCNTADAVDNYIEYRITRDRQTVYWGTGASQTDHLTLARCENGRFFAIVPKPNDSVLADGGTDYVEYQMHFQIYTTKDKLQYKAGEQAPIFNIYVQKNAACN